MGITIMHFIMALGIAFLGFFTGLVLGEKKEAEKVKRKIPCGEISIRDAEDAFRSIKEKIQADIDVKAVLWLYGIFFIVYASLLLLAYTSLRTEYIDAYKEHKIVEKVKYEYKVIDGEKTLTDSTFFYERAK